jgi:peptide/nickel transport system substrate-binding protein
MILQQPVSMSARLSKVTSWMVVGLVAVTAITAVPGRAAQGADGGEVPYLVSAVAAGKMAPMQDRLPTSPRQVDPRTTGGTMGTYGGRMRWLMGKPKDLRMVAYYGYARLICYNDKYELVPDILEKYEVEEGRIFTFHLRPGHKWSDGQPLTSEDFRYVWEDLYNDKRMGKRVPSVMHVEGKPPVFEVLSETSVRYTWEQANPQFLSALAGTLPLVIAMPFHYVKQFHPRYADPKKLAAKVKAARVSKPKSLHKRMTRAITFQNPDLPVLSPWYNTTPRPSSLFIFKRNPYYHRVDPKGRQLPYIDEVHMSIGSRSLIPAKSGSGDSDLQARYLRFDDYTFLKAAERQGKIKVHLWEKANGSHMAIIPNLTTKDPVWRKLLRDKRMRRALSHGINRQEINAAIFFGLARTSGDTLLPRSPLYKDEYAKKWIKFDIAEANRLLDDMGLQKRAYDGIRYLPDGRRAEIILDTSGESTEQTDVLNLIQDSWRQIGIAMFPRPTQRDLFRKRVYSGESIMSVWSGHNNGLAGPRTNPEFLAPVSQAQLQWPDWGLHAQSSGKKGVAPELPAARELMALLRDWKRSKDEIEQTRIWHEMLSIYSDNLFTIGILNGTKQPVVTAPNLQNVPSDGVFAFSPGAYFGVYNPDTFYYAPTKAADASTQAKGR